MVAVAGREDVVAMAKVLPRAPFFPMAGQVATREMADTDRPVELADWEGEPTAVQPTWPVEVLSWMM
jgi:hypothetical protein